MDKCPYCGSDRGICRTFTGTQYYRWDGEPDGYEMHETENQQVFVRCIQCNKKITLRRILRDAGNTQ